MPEGLSSGGGQEAELGRLQSILQSPQFQQLPDDKKKELLLRSRQMVQTIKGGGVQ